MVAGCRPKARRSCLEGHESCPEGQQSWVDPPSRHVVSPTYSLALGGAAVAGAVPAGVAAGDVAVVDAAGVAVWGLAFLVMTSGGIQAFRAW